MTHITATPYHLLLLIEYAIAGYSKLELAISWFLSKLFLTNKEAGGFSCHHCPVPHRRDFKCHCSLERDGLY